MVEVTEAANEVLLNNLTDASVPAEIGYRLVVATNGYRLRLDRPSEEDRVIRDEGHVLFMIEQNLDEQLDELVLDVGDDGDRLTLE